jgi:uncharacterized protein YukE
MNTAAGDVEGFAGDYESAADALETSIKSAISDWEGEAQLKFTALMDGMVREFTHDAVPGMVRVISQQITMSAENMKNTDQQLADSIP